MVDLLLEVVIEEILPLGSHAFVEPSKEDCEQDCMGDLSEPTVVPKGSLMVELGASGVVLAGPVVLVQFSVTGRWQEPNTVHHRLVTVEFDEGALSLRIVWEGLGLDFFVLQSIKFLMGFNGGGHALR